MDIDSKKEAFTESFYKDFNGHYLDFDCGETVQLDGFFTIKDLERVICAKKEFDLIREVE